MANLNKWVRSVALVGAASLALAACGGGSGTGSSSSSSGAATSSSAASSSASAGVAGGTLYFLQNYPFESVDPTRIYYGLELANFRRLFYRSLVAYPASADATTGNTPVPDLATDTGTTPDNGKTWSFTLKDGIKWQDGSPITCEDFKYGASRVFATDVLTGGPNYLLSYLDIPQKNGLPIYDGPYKGDNQAAFDKAVTCDGNTITYHFNKAWPDFPLAVASLMTTDPYKQSFDKGPKSTWTIMSNGPYEIQGSYDWDKNTGATLVRNPNYDPSTDSPDVRMALPDKIEYKIDGSSQATNNFTDLLIADAGTAACSITNAGIPPSYFTQVQDPPVSDRTNLVVSPFTFYLVPNFNNPAMQNPLVRQALAMATNKDAYIKAIGGDKVASPADSIVNPGVAGYTPNPAFANIPTAGDVAQAKALLEQAGVTLPVNITYTYHQGTTADKAAAALKETWDQAGFNTTLDPLTDTYYDVISKPNTKSSVYLAGWGADWPSPMTDLPPLFDSRPNLTQNSNGQDYGAYKSDAFNALVDQANQAASIPDMLKVMQQADALLGTDVAYIPIYNLNFYTIHGGAITNFLPTPPSNMNPDLGVIGVDPTKCP